jgi:hypothetical protein
MEKAAIEWQAALRGNGATVSISDGADRHSLTVSRFAQFHTGAKRIEYITDSDPWSGVGG